MRKLLKPWHEFKPEWVREASVIVQGTGYITEGACIFFGDGASGIPEVEAFRIQKVLKGRVRCSNIEFRFDTFTGLPYFVEGRNYLLFLTPDSGDSKGLADPKGFGFVGPDKAVVALIDLSETKSEVLARNVKAMRSGKFEGFEFTPKKWDAMRRAKKVDYRQQARLIKFLENVVLLQGKTPVDIGQYLGLPDYQYTPSEATYYLNIPASTSSKDGQIFSDLELKFHPGGSLASYTIEPMRTKRESSYGYSSNILSNEEMTKLGLRRVTNSFLPGN